MRGARGSLGLVGILLGAKRRWKVIEEELAFACVKNRHFPAFNDLRNEMVRVYHSVRLRVGGSRVLENCRLGGRIAW